MSNHPRELTPEKATELTDMLVFFRAQAMQARGRYDGLHSSVVEDWVKEQKKYWENVGAGFAWAIKLTEQSQKGSRGIPPSDTKRNRRNLI